jgi:hypothetical protein
VTAWHEAARAAAELQAAYPEWTVRPLQVRAGVRVSAVRDSDGTSLIGMPAEVQAVVGAEAVA